MIKDYFILGFKNVKKRKLRSWLTMIGIFVSIAIIFTLISISLGLSGFIEDQFEELGADVFFIQPRGQIAGPGTPTPVLLTEDDIREIKRVSGVQDATYWTVASSRVEFRGETRFVMVAGMPAEGFSFFEDLSSFSVQEGEFLSRGDRGRIVVGSQHSASFFSRSAYPGDVMLVNGERFRIKGVLKASGSPQDDRMVLMLMDDFRELFNISERVDFIYVRAQPGSDLRDVALRVEQRLIRSRGLTESTKDFSVTTPEDLLRSFETVLNIITGFLIGIAAISLLVGSIGIANTMYTSVLERRKEIGIMKAVGARNRDVLSLFVIESGLLGLAGGVIGVALGIAIGKSVEYAAFMYLGATLLKVSTPFWLIAGCVTFAFCVGAISGAMPAMQASRVKPTDALRAE
jgi:putative ABC transport system permease protein